MTAPPVLLDAPAAPATRTPGGLGWLLGGLTAGLAVLAASVVAVVAAAVLAVVAVLVLLVALLAAAAWRMRGKRGDGGATVINARWTGYGWDAR